MREQLIRYIELLFAGTPGAGDIKQEILQNTLDRYDDLVAQGKAPEAAYSLAISGIGDVSELLSSAPSSSAAPVAAPQAVAVEKADTPMWKKVVRAIAIFLYIISILPIIVLSIVGLEILGLCAMLGIVGIATALMVIASSDSKKEDKPQEPLTPRQELNKAIKTTVTTVGLVIYFALSFLTQAWHITWLVFPIMAAVRGLILACLDMKEANTHEN